MRSRTSCTGASSAAGRALVLRVLLLTTVYFATQASADDEVVTVETIKPEADDVVYISPDSHADVFFSDHFDSSADFERKWIKSSAKKDDADSTIAKYDGVWLLESAQNNALSGDLGLVLKSKAKHAAIAAPLKKTFKFADEKSFIVQYELNFQAGQDCGGGYIKLLSQRPDLRQFTDKTPYTIMFGPDKCGSDSKLHFIFRHVNPKNKITEEKHCKKLETKERSTFDEYFKDKRPHLYRLEIHSDNSFDMSIDYKVLVHGSLEDSFEPPVNPAAEIDDPDDFKPETWDEREKIPDPDASKPDDWDESQPRQILDEEATMPEGWMEDEPDLIPDPAAEKPDDWDEDIDGDWEAPLIDNPACKDAIGCGRWTQPLIDNPLYKGKWSAALIDNPAYKGKWKPRLITNPDYFHDAEPFRMTPIGAVGIELWSMSDQLYFDNLLITDNRAIADKWSAETFDLKVQKLDANDAGLFRRILLYSNRNPWLYAVYVVVIGLPLVLIFTFCCSGGGDKDVDATTANGKSALNDPKKTDAAQDDDAAAADEEEEEEEESEEEDEAGAEAAGDAVAAAEAPIENGDEAPLIEPEEEERRTSPRKRTTVKKE